LALCIYLVNSGILSGVRRDGFCDLHCPRRWMVCNGEENSKEVQRMGSSVYWARVVGWITDNWKDVVSHNHVRRLRSVCALSWKIKAPTFISILCTLITTQSISFQYSHWSPSSRPCYKRAAHLCDYWLYIRWDVIE
jgi:hypothetical protein